MLELLLFGNALSDSRQQLHQAKSVLIRDRIRIELRLLPDQGSDHIRVKSIRRREALQVVPVWTGEQAFPVRAWERGKIQCEIVRNRSLEGFDCEIVTACVLIHARGFA